MEWDTLLFFFGVIFAVGGLGVAGYLALLSNFLYGDLGPTVLLRGISCETPTSSRLGLGEPRQPVDTVIASRYKPPSPD